VVAYHYVRDPGQNRFPRLHAMSADDFRAQVDCLASRCEMATVESAMAFLSGTHRPTRDMCLLTFDDGVRDHADTVFPHLADRGIEGVFFLITSCLNGGMAPVHKNHFLTAELGFAEFRRRVVTQLEERGGVPAVDAGAAARTYRWDTQEVAEFKHLLNFVLSDAVRDAVVDEVFAACLGDSREFSRELYLNWSDAAAMQRGGMAIGGHTHTHPVLARLTPAEQGFELTTSSAEMRRRLPDQSLWPFSYPYGKPDAFDSTSVALLRELAFCCGFTSVPGQNRPAAPPFTLHRIDPKEAAHL
jgi:peptidoglycan/xylan/chitin deacetylase (PgdA/CDA1 family)